MRLGPDAFNFTFELAAEAARLIDAEHLELDARRPGICNEDCVHGASRRRQAGFATAGVSIESRDRTRRETRSDRIRA